MRAGVRWGAATGALIAGYTVIDGYAVKVLLIVADPRRLRRQPAARATSGAGLAARPAGPALGLAQRNGAHALVVATLGPLAYVLVLYAVHLAPVSHVAPAREVSMLFAALLGGRLLGEGDRGLRIAGAICIAAGVIALATA